MKDVILMFPDNRTMTEFILKHTISRAEVNSIDHILTAILSEDEIKHACKEYGAIYNLKLPDDPDDII